MDLGRAITRFVIGPLFVGHGTQKLFGWFEGHPQGAPEQRPMDRQWRLRVQPSRWSPVDQPA